MFIRLCLVLLLAGCAVQTVKTVRQEDLDAWVDVPVDALNTHSLFLTIPMYKTFTESGVEIRNYVNGINLAPQCFSYGSGYVTGNNISSNTFTQCTAATSIVCNNIFYIFNGRVIKYVPTGRCYTDETAQPQGIYKPPI
jgi:hypothetical protein